MSNFSVSIYHHNDSFELENWYFLEEYSSVDEIYDKKEITIVAYPSDCDLKIGETFDMKINSHYYNLDSELDGVILKNVYLEDIEIKNSGIWIYHFKILGSVYDKWGNEITCRNEDMIKNIIQDILSEEC